jgi:hypothetical protein
MPFVSSETFPSSITLLVFMTISFNRVDLDWMFAFRESIFNLNQSRRENQRSLRDFFSYRYARTSHARATFGSEHSNDAHFLWCA